MIVAWEKFGENAHRIRWAVKTDDLVSELFLDGGLGIEPSFGAHHLAHLFLIHAGALAVDLGQLNVHPLGLVGGFAKILGSSAHSSLSFVDHNLPIRHDTDHIRCHGDHRCHRRGQSVDCRGDFHATLAKAKQFVVERESVEDRAAGTVDLDFQFIDRVLKAVGQLSGVLARLCRAGTEKSSDLLDQIVHHGLHNCVLEPDLARLVLD